jgi:hypothetical protein
MANPVSVKWFASSMTGAPALSGQAGKLLDILNPCLLANDAGGGFGSVTLSSLVVASSVATATVSAGHGFTDYVVAVIAGATPSGLNGDKRITVTGSTTFTFDATGISDQTATGTITAKVSGLGWVRTYSGTNTAAYSRTAVASTAMMLRVDDAPTQYSGVIMYESMSNIDTGTKPAPTTSTLYIPKSNTADGTARSWRLFADDRLFYLFVGTDGTAWKTQAIFGDINSYLSGDAYQAMLLSSVINNSNNYGNLVYCDNNTTGCWLSRSYTQVGSAVLSGRYSFRPCQYIGQGGMTIANPVNNSIHFWPVECWEGTNARGTLPGLFCPPHSGANNDGFIINGPQKKYMFQNLWNAYSGYAQSLIDITGPWR